MNCKICGEIIIEHYKGNNKECKECVKNRAREWRLNNKQKKKETDKNWALNNKERKKQNSINWSLNNKEKRKEISKKYYENNKEKCLERTKICYNKRLENNDLLKCITKIRKLIWCAFRDKKYSKKSTTYKILGCTYEDFKNYIESQFEDWMTWDNHGIYTGKYNETWQYDHMIPVSSGYSEEEIIKLNHYTNFKPLCSRKNLEKGNKLFVSNH